MRLGLLVSAPAQAQVAESKLTSPAAEPDQSRAVPATLRIPAAGKISAVVVVHGTGGVDGRGAFHIQALNAAGIATLEVDYFTARDLRPGAAQRPSSSQMLTCFSSRLTRRSIRHASASPGFRWAGSRRS